MQELQYRIYRKGQPHDEMLFGENRVKGSHLRNLLSAEFADGNYKVMMPSEPALSWMHLLWQSSREYLQRSDLFAGTAHRMKYAASCNRHNFRIPDRLAGCVNRNFSEVF